MSFAEIRTERDPATEKVNEFLNQTWRGQGLNLDTILPIILLQKGKGRDRYVFPVIVDSTKENLLKEALFQGYVAGAANDDMKTLFIRDGSGLKLSVKASLPEVEYSRDDSNGNGIILLDKEASYWNKTMMHWENHSKIEQFMYDCGIMTDRISGAKRKLFVITFANSQEVKNDIVGRYYAGQWIMSAVMHQYARPGEAPPYGGDIINS